MRVAVIRLLLSRLLAAVPLLLVVTFCTFVLMGVVGTDPAEQVAGDLATQERIEEVRADLGLDRPLPVRYVSWLADAARGDLGRSYYSGGEVSELIARRLPPTITLAVAATLIASVVGIGAAVTAALRPGGRLDRTLTVVTSGLLATPPFWVAMVLVTVLALRLNWVPATGWVPFEQSPSGWARSLVAPTLALSLGASAVVARQCRTSLAFITHAGYITAAQARGCSPAQALLRHGLRNALGPTVTVIGLQLTALLGGALVAEQVFAIPGLGSLALSAVADQDLPVVLGIVMVSAVVVTITNTAADMMLGLLNPKVRVA
jgi:peptide/nickel transport system permease protein